MEGNTTPETIKKGDILMVMSAYEEHEVLDVLEGGYLKVQCTAFKRAGLEGGVNYIHASEVDGVYIKKVAG